MCIATEQSAARPESRSRPMAACLCEYARAQVERDLWMV
jgi:hypothetical protein